MEADIWLELHNRQARDRLKLTVIRFAAGDYAYIEGGLWGPLSSGQQRLLRRLGLIDGKRGCLWLEVWYREV